jgi:hypothetical protein
LISRVPEGKDKAQKYNNDTTTIAHSRMEVGSGNNIFYYKYSQNSEAT